MKRFLSVLTMLASLAIVFHGCTKEETTSPWGGDGDAEASSEYCLGCHGDDDRLKELLPPDGKGYAIVNRDDG